MPTLAAFCFCRNNNVLFFRRAAEGEGDGGRGLGPWVGICFWAGWCSAYYVCLAAGGVRARVGR